MPISNYVIRCYSKGCANEAVHKIASQWSDGVTGELKTYSLCCDRCLPARFHESRGKPAACRLAPGESLELPGIYRLGRGQRDRELEREADLEAQLIAGTN